MSEWYNPNVPPRLLSLINDHPELKQGVETLIEILDEGGMFSSLAVQVHYGDAIKQGHVHWHTDWANSLWYLGMAVRDVPPKSAADQMGIVGGNGRDNNLQEL